MGMGLPAVVSPTSAPPLIPLAEGDEPLRAGALHQGRLVSRSGRVPQGRRLADSQDAAPPEQARACRVHHLDGSGTAGFTFPTLNRAPAGLSKWR